MNIQSLSILVPTKGSCVNNCKFCVSRMHKNKVEDMIGQPNLYSNLYISDYIKRLNYAKSNGCETMLITGDTEPQQNFNFLEKLGLMVEKMDFPFEKIEIQTTGTGLTNDWLYFLRHSVGVSTVAISASSFIDKENNEIMETKEKVALGFMDSTSGYVKLKELCKRIKTYRFNLRLTLNLTDSFSTMSPKEILEFAHLELGADQVTFRVLYKSSDTFEDWTAEDFWINEHALSIDKLKEIQDYIKNNGRYDRTLEFGQKVYFINDMSIIVDDDCMNSKKFKEIENEKETMLKSLILRQNCKLYTNWDTKVVYY